MVSTRPAFPVTVQLRRANPLTSVGLSMKYAMSGAAQAMESLPAMSWVATRQPLPSGGVKRTATGRFSRPRAQANVAGMLRCAWLRSICE